MPGIVNGIIHAQLRVPIWVRAPERAMLMHIGHDDKIRLVEIRFIRVKVCVRNAGLRPAHAALACAVRDACMDLAERRLDVVVEPRRDADAGRPELNVRKFRSRVVCEVDVEADEVEEFEVLDTLLVGAARVVCRAHLEAAVCPWPVCAANPRKLHRAHVVGSVSREDIVRNKLAHRAERWRPRCA